MIDNIYKIVKPSRLKNLQSIENTKSLVSQVIFIFSDWILVKQIMIFSTSLRCWEKQVSKMLPGGMSYFLLPRM